jgi:hypothetical protein
VNAGALDKSAPSIAKRHYAGGGKDGRKSYFSPIEAHFCENPLLIFFGAVPGRLPRQEDGVRGASLWSCR